MNCPRNGGDLRSVLHRSTSRRGRRMRYAKWASTLCLAALATVVAVTSAENAPTKIHPAIQAAVDSPDRPEADRKRDEGRRPAIVLEFFGVRPGQTLIEYTATGGVTAELLARAVGPKGKVYMQNPPAYLERAGTKDIEARLAN